MFWLWDWPNIILVLHYQRNGCLTLGLFMRVKIKTWPKPETAYEKTLAPRVVNIIVKVQEISKQSTTLVYNMHDMLL